MGWRVRITEAETVMVNCYLVSQHFGLSHCLEWLIVSEDQAFLQSAKARKSGMSPRVMPLTGLHNCSAENMYSCH